MARIRENFLEAGMGEWSKTFGYVYCADPGQRVLFAFFVAVIVAVSETALYIIWQSRSSSSSSQPVRRKYIRAKKQDGDPHSTSATAKEEDYPDGLRLRIQATTSKD